MYIRTETSSLDLVVSKCTFARLWLGKEPYSIVKAHILVYSSAVINTSINFNEIGLSDVGVIY